MSRDPSHASNVARNGGDRNASPLGSILLTSQDQVESIG